MAGLHFLAMDFGSGSGIGIVGSFDGSRIALNEISRFPNYYVSIGDTFYWDVFHLFHQILLSVCKSEQIYGTGQIASLGIDTWGTDYGLLDCKGQPVGGCRCIRNTDGQGMEAISNILSRSYLYKATGCQAMSGNTVCQLMERKLKDDIALETAKTLLLIPDILTYYLTGEMYADYTAASTTMMLDPLKKQWNRELVRKLGLPDHILPEVHMPCQDTFMLHNSLAGQGGRWKLVPVAAHDTASAIAAAPLRQNEIVCSSGTWSIIGVERDEPLINDKALELNFSNEGTIDGKIRFIKNCMGMWAIQQCVSQWHQDGMELSWSEVVEQAQAAVPFRSLVNLEEPEFYNAGKIQEKIERYCEKTHQPVPESTGQVARCIYESMAMRYRMIAEQLQEVTGQGFTGLRIVGGGAQNRLLNQFTANALGIPIYAGPVEAACVGNALAQAVAAGELKDFTEIREVAEQSFEITVYEPQCSWSWDEAYQRYQKLLKVDKDSAAEIGGHQGSAGRTRKDW